MAGTAGQRELGHALCVRVMQRQDNLWYMVSCISGQEAFCNGQDSVAGGTVPKTNSVPLKNSERQTAGLSFALDLLFSGRPPPYPSSDVHDISSELTNVRNLIVD